MVQIYNSAYNTWCTLQRFGARLTKKNTRYKLSAIYISVDLSHHMYLPVMSKHMMGCLDKCGLWCTHWRRYETFWDSVGCAHLNRCMLPAMFCNKNGYTIYILYTGCGFTPFNIHVVFLYSWFLHIKKHDISRLRLYTYVEILGDMCVRGVGRIKSMHIRTT